MPKRDRTRRQSNKLPAPRLPRGSRVELALVAQPRVSRWYPHDPLQYQYRHSSLRQYHLAVRLNFNKTSIGLLNPTLYIDPQVVTSGVAPMGFRRVLAEIP
jgi:hypothetical protein